MTKRSLGKTQHGGEWFDVGIDPSEATSLQAAIELASAEIEVVRAGGKSTMTGAVDPLGWWAQGPTKGTKVYGP